MDQNRANPENAAVQLKEAAARGNVLLLLKRHGMSRFVGLSVENIRREGSTAERAIEELGWDAAAFPDGDFPTWRGDRADRCLIA
jgi:hypothetical protein